MRSKPSVLGEELVSAHRPTLSLSSESESLLNAPKIGGVTYVNRCSTIRKAAATPQNNLPLSISQSKTLDTLEKVKKLTFLVQSISSEDAIYTIE